MSASTSAAGGQDSGGDEVDVAPRVRRLDAGLDHRLDQPVALSHPHARLQPAEHAAEPDEPDSIATLEVARRQRGRSPDGLHEHAAVRAAHVDEAVDEQHDVRVPLRVPLVHHEALPASGGAPVDRANPVARDEVPDVGVLDAVALRASDLAARERLGLERREELGARSSASDTPSGGTSSRADPPR